MHVLLYRNGYRQEFDLTAFEVRALGLRLLRLLPSVRKGDLDDIVRRTMKDARSGRLTQRWSSDG